MIDREKAIIGLECCIKQAEDAMHQCAEECPYAEIGIHCFVALNRDALVLLKEQEPIKPKSKVRHGANAQIQHFCGNCNTMLHGKPKFCSECGKKVLW